MGTIDDRPDHVPIPTSFPTVNLEAAAQAATKVVSTATVAAVVTFPLCPEYPEKFHHDHAPHHELPVEGDFAPTAWAWVASGSSSGSSVTPDVSTAWMGNSIDAANTVIAARNWSRRFVTGRMGGSTSAGVLGSF